MTRECLKCGRKFESAGPWNRLCQSCNSDNAKLPVHVLRRAEEPEREEEA